MIKEVRKLTINDLNCLQEQIVRMVFRFPDHSIIAVRTTLNRKILNSYFGSSNIDGIIDLDFKVIVPEYIFYESEVSIDLKVNSDEEFYEDFRLIDIAVERGLKLSWKKL